MSVCEVCGREMVPYAGTLLCPGAVREIEDYESDVRRIIEEARDR